jgi:hypothetical protein
MNDKELIEILQKISKQCHKTKFTRGIRCKNCIFRRDSKTNPCQIRFLLTILASDEPSCWDMKRIERAINE